MPDNEFDYRGALSISTGGFDCSEMNVQIIGIIGNLQSSPGFHNNAKRDPCCSPLKCSQSSGYDALSFICEL